MTWKKPDLNNIRKIYQLPPRGYLTRFPPSEWPEIGGEGREHPLQVVENDSFAHAPLLGPQTKELSPTGYLVY